MSEPIIYTIPGKSRSKLGFVLSALIICGTGLEMLFTQTAPLGLFVLFGIFFYVTSISTTTLTDDAVIVKPILGRERTFPLKTGVFEIKESSSFSTKLSCLKSVADTLIYTPAGGSPVMVMNGLYDIEDVKALYAEAEKRQKTALGVEA